MALVVCNHRPIGGVGDPEWTDEALPPLGRAGPVVVGVIDTGIVLDRRRRPPAWFGRHHLSYCVEEDADESAHPRGERLPSDGHGTFVSGLVLREAPTARVRMWGVLAKARVPAAADEATDRDDQAVMAALAALAINSAVQVVNLSFGDALPPEEEKRFDAFAKAVASFVEARPDVAVVAAAGNGGTDAAFFPAAFPEVLAVGAVDETRFEKDPETGLAPRLLPSDRPPIANFSNTGEWVGAYARGVHVLGPLPLGEQKWARWNGTSFAAAVVSGRIAQVAIERGLSGLAAKEAVLAESDALEGGAKWIRSVDSVNKVPTT